MGYHQGTKTVTVTTDGRQADIKADFTTKTVSVFIAGEYKGTYKTWTAAKEALGLIDVPAKGRK